MNTRLLSFEEIQDQLSSKLAQVPQDIRDECSDLSLNPSNLSNSDISQIEDTLKIQLPSKFKKTILRYDFGDSSIGNVWFGRLTKYSSWIIANNSIARNSSQLPVPWWGDGTRPENLILIANTDGYVFILNVQSEEILSFSRSTTWQDVEVVAKNFEVFVRLVGTVYLSYDRPATELELLAFKSIFDIRNTELPSFWKDLLLGIT